MAPNKVTGFSMFMRDYIDSKKLSLDFENTMNVCGNIWKDMSEAQRAPFMAAAKNARQQKETRPNAMACNGMLLSVVEQKQRTAAQEVQDMVRAIEDVVIAAKNINELENVKFVFVAFNYFSKLPNTDLYLPAEFAASVFSLKSGIIDVFSSHINPNVSVLGEACEASEHTIRTHQLPLPPQALGEKNLTELFGNIMEYLHKIEPNSIGPVMVYTDNNLMSVVKGCFKYIAGDAIKDDISDMISIANIQYLFYALKKQYAPASGLRDFVLKPLAGAYFARDHFEYEAGISCQFHEENDRSKYCVKSMVTRWSYSLTSYLCGDSAIKKVGDKEKTSNDSARISNQQQGLAASSITSRFREISIGNSNKESNANNFKPKDYTTFDADEKDFPTLDGPRRKKK